MYRLIFIYLVLINLLTWAVFGADKRRAVRGRWRVSEAMLLILCFLGGSIGAMIGMRMFHHKTRKPKFKVGIPVILLLQLASAVLILLR